MTEWLPCPGCRKKTRVKLRDDTELKNYLVFCSWCRREFLVDVKQKKITSIAMVTKPDAGRCANG